MDRFPDRTACAAYAELFVCLLPGARLGDAK